MAEKVMADTATVKKEKVKRTPRQKGILAAKIIAVIFGILALIGVALLAVWKVALNKEVKLEQAYIAQYGEDGELLKTPSVAPQGVDRIHFINVASGNAILLESNGHFALFDAGEDTNNNPPKAEVNAGYEKVVIDYLKKYAADEQGKVKLDFIVGTHAHSDHIGAFDEILDDEDITAEKCFLKEYLYEEKMLGFEATWDNQEVYDQLIEACKRNSVEVISDKIPTEAWQWQDWTIQFFNTEVTNKKNMDENCQSICTKLTKTSTGKTALIVGDLNYIPPNNEKKVANQVGKCDLLQLGHHGYALSSAPYIFKKVTPSIAIACNETRDAVYPDVRCSTALVGKSALFVQGEQNGIIADYTDGADIVLYSDSCQGIAERYERE